MCLLCRKRQPPKKKENSIQLQAIPEQGLKAKSSSLNLNIFIVYSFKYYILSYLDEEVQFPAVDETYYTNQQIHAKHIKIRELSSTIHSLEHDIQDGFEKEFCVGLDFKKIGG